MNGVMTGLKIGYSTGDNSDHRKKTVEVNGRITDLYIGTTHVDDG